MTVPLMCFLPESGRIQISGGRSGSYLVSISGKRIKDGSVMMEVEEIVLDHLDINDYYLTDLNYLQWEDWDQITKFAPVQEITDNIINPMLKHNTSHNQWQQLI